MLRRMIALLVALAVLAERAADRSLAVRFFVLWLLRRAEAAAAGYVFEQAVVPPTAIERFAAVGNDRADALRLAARFTALAAALRALLPDACPFASRTARGGVASGRVAVNSSRPLHGWTPEPFDTS